MRYLFNVFYKYINRIVNHFNGFINACMYNSGNRGYVIYDSYLVIGFYKVIYNKTTIRESGTLVDNNVCIKSSI